MCPFRSKTWAGRSPELAGLLYVEFRAVQSALRSHFAVTLIAKYVETLKIIFEIAE